METQPQFICKSTQNAAIDEIINTEDALFSGALARAIGIGTKKPGTAGAVRAVFESLLMQINLRGAHDCCCASPPGLIPIPL
ncbi:hypothetical protein [Azohydromonas caseinilytica]|uniref:Uncharacterized protein n=1 Tax=Azohydromonas caseinilytica TaxID=2728836 RepID=A0A848FDV1_9BURK|nr:hypothetical protein [Azohydromonas caseinilytica]NML17482.1 hypothetical protein [Azohydromonas caseinilytica]